MLTIEHPLTGEKLQIANKDFSSQMNWYDAIDACEKLGSGWRLPTYEELLAMYEELHEKGQGNFEEACYWCSKEFRTEMAWYKCFGGMATIGDKNKTQKSVRAVRDL
jgi:hypothetical protein